MSIAKKLQTIAENEQKVYDAGKKAEYDIFWDTYQNSGRRTGYNYAFCSWAVNAFKPKYDIKPTTMTACFMDLKTTDFIGVLEAQGIEFSTANCTNFQSAFSAFKGLIIPELDTRKCSAFDYAFGSMASHTITKLILKSDGTQTFSSSFASASSLKNIVIEGLIGKSINFNSCPLTVASMKSVIEHLKDFTGTNSANTQTLKFNTSCWTELNAETPPDGYADWQDYVTQGLKWLV